MQKRCALILLAFGAGGWEGAIWRKNRGRTRRTSCFYLEPQPFIVRVGLVHRTLSPTSPTPHFSLQLHRPS